MWYGFNVLWFFSAGGQNPEISVEKIKIDENEPFVRTANSSEFSYDLKGVEYETGSHSIEVYQVGDRTNSIDGAKSSKSLFFFAFDQMLPALFGALGVALISKNWKLAIAPVTLMLILFVFVPALNAGMVGIMVPVGVIFTIITSRIMYKKNLL